MDTFGLIGYPLAHSFSLKFFTEKFEREGIDAEYLNFEIEDIREIQRVVLSNQYLRGLNVTIPHKEKVIPFLTRMTPEAQKIGAVNTIRVERTSTHTPGYQNDTPGYQLVGHNTDYVGFKESIAPLLIRDMHRKALVLGTGGASKAVVQAFADMGIEWKYVSRTPTKDQLSYRDLSLTPELLSEYTVVVNASPVGTFPNENQCPAIPYEQLTPRHLLYDLVYNPEATLFLVKGNERGAIIKNGKEMLERQALAAWEFWKT